MKLKEGYHYTVTGMLRHRGKDYKIVTMSGDYIGWFRDLDNKYYRTFRRDGYGNVTFREDGLIVNHSKRD